MKKVLKSGLLIFTGSLLGLVTVGLLKGKNKKSNNDKKIEFGKAQKFQKYYEITNRWILLKNEGISLEKYFQDKGYREIAIYGMGELGNRLLEELKSSPSVEVKYGIDKLKGHTYTDLPMKVLSESSKESLSGVDVIVVTAVFDINNIREKLEEVTDCEIISLEDVVFGL